MEIQQEFMCSCGKVHRAMIGGYIAESGAIQRLPQYIAEYGCKKTFVFADDHTYDAAGARVCKVLEQAGIAYSLYVFPPSKIEPDEHAVGSLVMHYEPSCDLIIGVGSGVMNDLGKILAHTVQKPYFIVATAPSMDGYASATSSMEMDGLKVSLSTTCADMIIGDLDILAHAPMHMMVSGLGDMLAKYISIAEWRIAHIVTGEYYCETVADMVREALAKCVNNREKLLARDPEAVKAVFEGLVLGGVAMNYAGVSRPASGVEHYFSHVWDMRSLEFGTNGDLHGIQCAVGTRCAASVYEQLKKTTPNREKALAKAAAFNYAEYAEMLRSYLGKGAEAMIALEKKEKKYDIDAHAKRFDIICNRWDDILAIIQEEIPAVAELDRILDDIRCSKYSEELGIPAEQLPTAFAATKDIRDKYVASRLCFDLGILDEIVFE